MHRLLRIVSLATGLAASSAHASAIYKFASLAPGATPTVANTTASQIYLRSTLFCSGSGGQGTCGPMLIINTTSLASIFSTTPLPGFALDISDLSLDKARSGIFGPTGFDVLSGIDVFTSFENYASTIMSTVLSPGAASVTEHSPSQGFTTLVDSLEVRIVSSGRP